jgi:hypothetical protein
MSYCDIEKSKKFSIIFFQTMAKAKSLDVKVNEFDF